MEGREGKEKKGKAKMACKPVLSPGNLQLISLVFFSFLFFFLSFLKMALGIKLRWISF